MFMDQGTLHPWSLILIDRAHSKYFILLIKDQFLRDGEQKPNLGEFCVPRNTYIFFITFSEMQSQIFSRS